MTGWLAQPLQQIGRAPQRDQGASLEPVALLDAWVFSNARVKLRSRGVGAMDAVGASRGFVSFNDSLGGGTRTPVGIGEPQPPVGRGHALLGAPPVA